MQNSKWEHQKNYSVLELGRDDNSGFLIEIDYDEYENFSWSIYSNTGTKIKSKCGYEKKENAIREAECEMLKIINPLVEWYRLKSEQFYSL